MSPRTPRAPARRALIAVAVVIAGLYGWVAYLRDHPRPCVRPILYSIGAVDPRFNVTNETLIDDARISAAIWNQAVGRRLLAYDPRAALKINLVYDDRQANATLGVALNNRQAAADSARADLDAMQQRFTSAQGFYNSDIAAVNNRGGATPIEALTLRTKHDSLALLADSLHEKVSLYNASVSAMNADVDQFNQQAGQTLKAGQYVRDSTGRRIDLFKFVGDTELERFLAHEFGHAIGLEHNADPVSIMYAKSENGGLTPSTADLVSLHAICGAAGK